MNDGGAKTVKSQSSFGIDRRDVVGIIGLSLLGIGLALINIPAALIVTGAIIIGVAIFGVR